MLKSEAAATSKESQIPVQHYAYSGPPSQQDVSFYPPPTDFVPSFMTQQGFAQPLQPFPMFTSHVQMAPAPAPPLSVQMPFMDKSYMPSACPAPSGVASMAPSSLAPSLHSAPTTASDSCSQISHVLQCYQQGGEDPDFVRKAIESLVKKLKDKRMELEALITAITSSGKQPTNCVTIQRSLDGRLQVAGRKGVPHVVYARIWRWPNVAKNELQKLPVCQVATDDQDYICINPYHYERVVSSGAIGPIDMTSLKLEPAQSIYNNAMIPPISYENASPAQNACFATSFDEWGRGWSQPQTQQPQQPPPTCIENEEYAAFSSRKYDLSSISVPLSQSLEHWCTISYYELDTQIGDSFKVHRELGTVTVDGGTNPHDVRNGRFCLGALSNVHRGEASDKARLHIGPGICLTASDDGSVSLSCHSQKPVFVCSGYLDYCEGRTAGSGIYRMTQLTPERKVFDLRWAYAEMCESTMCANAAVRAQAAAVAGYGAASVQLPNMPEMLAGSGVDEMRRAYCNISISFLKGWGGNYPRRTIKETPCWIEVQLHRPLQLLDQLLKN